MKIIKQIPPILSNAWVGIDLEISDADQKRLHRPVTGNFACMTIAHEDDVYVITSLDDVSQALQNVSKCWWIFHHAKFDLTHLRRWADIPPRKKLWDTMIVDKILWGGYYTDFGLNDLVRRYLDMYLDKSLQMSFTNAGLTPEQEQYAALDAWVLPKIVEHQKQYLDEKQFYIWNEIDRPAMFAFMDFAGFRLDVKAWSDLAIKHRQLQESIDAELPINPRSYKQVIDYLKKNGFPRLSESGEETLKKFAEKYPDTVAAQVTAKILESRMYGKRASTYGMNFIEDFLEGEYIFANYNVVGAETGRTSSSSPNFQNIIARDTKDFRKCYIASPGHVLLIADYSQQEIFIAAYISGDEKLIEICNSGKDIYIMMAKLMFNKDIEKTDPIRKQMKAVVLGANYGMSAIGLARKEHIPEEEAESILNKLYKAFPDYHQWMIGQKRKSKFVETVSGRRIWLNPYDNQHERNALNAPTQGSAGDCMKKALANLHQAWPKDISFGVVGYIHDELVLDVPEERTTWIAELVKQTMINTANQMFLGMKFRADVSIGKTWADKE